MVRNGGGRWKWWRRRRKTTAALCFVNLLALLYVVRALYASLYVFSSSSPASLAYASSGFASFREIEFLEDQIERMKDSIRLRTAANPSELARLLNNLKKKKIARRDSGLSPPTKQKLADEILQMLKALEPHAYLTDQQEALERWRMAKLESLKRAKKASGSSGEVERALEDNWLVLLEEIGLCMPVEVNNEEVNEELLTFPPKCRVEPHTEYEGLVVKQGLTNLKESAVDCCQACVDQSKNAVDGEIRCNIWVYCPSKDGCHSTDRNMHKFGECLLKQADRPRVRFKDTFPEEFRDSHPSAPLIVPWISGVVR